MTHLWLGSWLALGFLFWLRGLTLFDMTQLKKTTNVFSHVGFGPCSPHQVRVAAPFAIPRGGCALMRRRKSQLPWRDSQRSRSQPASLVYLVMFYFPNKKSTCCGIDRGIWEKYGKSNFLGGLKQRRVFWPHWGVLTVTLKARCSIEVVPGASGIFL